ncbi:MAG: hypothetical protein D6731_00300 [Planctomycetota bacterium]|nr:MAG: hypothetical protein D6731_00300 [Planctomycetota bacterium]
MVGRIQVLVAIGFGALLAAPTPGLAQEGGAPAAPKEGQGVEAPPPARPEGAEEAPRKRPRRGARRFQRGQLPVELLRKELDLSPEQVQRLEAVNARVRERWKELRKRFQEGTFDPRTLRRSFQETRKLVEEEVRSVLTPEQTKKWEAWRKQQQRRYGRAWGNQRRNREELGKRLKQQALEALRLDAETRAAVEPLLDTVFHTRQLILEEQERRRDELRRKLRETNDPEVLQKLLAEFRDANRADRDQLKAAQEQLREVLTVEQEARLVALNILD